VYILFAWWSPNGQQKTTPLPRPGRNTSSVRLNGTKWEAAARRTFHTFDNRNLQNSVRMWCLTHMVLINYHYLQRKIHRVEMEVYLFEVDWLYQITPNPETFIHANQQQQQKNTKTPINNYTFQNTVHNCMLKIIIYCLLQSFVVFEPKHCILKCHFSYIWSEFILDLPRFLVFF